MTAPSPESLVSRLTGDAPARLPRHIHQLPRDMVIRSQRGRILRSVAEAVAAKGYAATSVADIIKRAGVSRSTFYELYDGKESAFLDAYSGLELVHQQLLATFRSGNDPEDMARRAIHAHLTGLAGEPAFTWMFFVEAVVAGPRVIARRRQATESLLDALTEMVDVARSVDPSVPPADRQLLVAFTGAARELIATHLLSADAQSLPELEDALVAVARRLLLGRV